MCTILTHQGPSQNRSEGNTHIITNCNQKIRRHNLAKEVEKIRAQYDDALHRLVANAQAVSTMQGSLKESRDAVMRQTQERSKLPAVMDNVRKYSSKFSHRAAELAAREAGLDKRIADLHRRMAETRSQIAMLSKDD